MEGGENININGSSESVKLAEKITGFRPDDPKIIDRLISDHERVAKKYKLPDIMQMFSQPEEYYRQLKGFLKDNEIPVVQNEATAAFFENNPEVVASYFTRIKALSINEKKVESPDFNKNTLLLLITHETIHALQDKNSPEMGIEEKEYEAHVGALPLKVLKDNPKVIQVEDIFKGVSQSVEIFNKQVIV